MPAESYSDEEERPGDVVQPEGDGAPPSHRRFTLTRPSGGRVTGDDVCHASEVSTPSFLLTQQRHPLSPSSAASRISAYVYGNILVLAALVPITTSPEYVGIAIVLGTALSTFIAHVFAETVAQAVRSGEQLTRSERIEELRDSVPILSSAVLPCLILLTAWIGWLEPRTAHILAEVAVLVRIGSTIFVVRRLQGRRPTTRTVVTAIGLALVATVVVIVKVILTH